MKTITEYKQTIREKIQNGMTILQAAEMVKESLMDTASKVELLEWLQQSPCADSALVEFCGISDIA